MADPNQQGPNSSTTAIVSSAKQMKREQGDFNDILKESIGLITKLSKSYNDIEARLETMNKSSINIKEINKVIDKAAASAYIANKQALIDRGKLETSSQTKVDKYIKGERIVAKLEERLNLAKQKGDDIEIETANKRYEKALSLVQKHKEGLSIEEMSAIQSQEAARLAKEAQMNAEKRLATEKRVKESIGLSGRVMGGLVDKLGFGSQAYEEMVEHARKLDEVGEKMTFGDKFKFLSKSIGKEIKKNITDPIIAIPGIYKAISKAGDKAGSGFAKAGSALAPLNPDSANNIGKLTSGVSGFIKNIPLVGGLIGGMVDGFSSMLDFVIGIDDTVIKAGRNLGLSSNEARKLNTHFQNISANNGDIFVTSKKLLETQVAIGTRLGINNQLTDEQLSTLVKLKDIDGLDEEVRANIAESSTITGKSAEDTTKAVLAQVTGLKNATGVSLNYKQTLKDASSFGGYLGLSFAKYPAQLAKSLVTTKAFGLELKQLESMADSFLDFESSISNEFEAQLLTGKQLNMSKARELFLNNDLAGAAQEISSQVGTSAEFLSMNRIQAESYAKGLGMSRDALGDMLKKQEFLAKIGAKQTDNAQKQYQLALAKYKTQKALNEALGDEDYQNMINASTQEKVANLIDKIKNSIVDFMQNSGLIEKVEGFINRISEPGNVKKIINSVKGFFADAVEFVGTAAYHILNALDYIAFGQIPNDFIESIKSGAESMGAQIRAAGGDFGGTSISSSKLNSTSPAAQGAQGATATAQTPNLHLRIEHKYDNFGKMVYRVVNEDSGQQTDWQTSTIGKTK